jgi:UDP-2,3-diacylglucosamine pyrophosphatase LpxH
MPLFVCSDLHLGEAGSARMFHDPVQGQALAGLCAEVRKRDGELILAGDIFDITAAMPPLHGLTRFGHAVGVHSIEDRPRPTLAEVLVSIRKNNPAAVDAIEALARERPVTLVPGNHDRHLLGDDAKAALAAAGLAGVKVEAQAVRKLGEKIACIQHGHAWDPSNATPEGGGEVMTGVLHNAVIPFLRKVAARKNVVIEPDRVVTLRPEERVVPVLERWLPQVQYEDFLDAFVEILVENGYLSRAISWLVTSDRIRERLKDDDDLWERAGRTALAALEGTKPIPGNPPPPDILVLGHTHVIDWAVQEGAPQHSAFTGLAGDPVQRLYVNLGTWSARASDAAGPLDPVLPVLEIELEQRRLLAMLRDRSGDGRVLQQFEVTR